MSSGVGLWLAMIGLVLVTIAALNSSHDAQNQGLPLVQSSAPISDEAKANMWFSPCPVDKRNVPLIPPESDT